MSQSLERGNEALLLLSSRKSLGVTELAELLSINKSSAFRIFESFKKYNLIEQDSFTAKYRLAPAILKLSEQVYKNFNIIAISRPFMIKLVEEINESAHLCKLSNDNAVIIEQIMVNSRLVVNARIGNEEPLHCSSVGKCLLAFTNVLLKESILSRITYQKFTDNTILNKKDLQKELLAIEEKGYAFDDGELSEEIKCIAAPIFNHLGEAIYSLGISVPTTRMTGDKLQGIATKTIQCARLISSRLGYVSGT